MRARCLAFWGLVFVLDASTAWAFEVRAVINEVDPAQRRVRFTAGGQERNAAVAPDASFLDTDGKALEGGLAAGALKPGAAVVITVERVDNKPLIRGIRLARGGASPAPATAEVSVDTSQLVPITDLGTGQYKGFAGGLYPEGRNTRPPAHDAAGRAIAATVQPLDADGKPDASGKIVLLGIGFSNSVQAFQGFMRVAQADDAVNPRLVLVNGAVGGMSAEMVQYDDRGRGAQYWSTVDERLKTAGVTRRQVQVLWIKETNPTPPGSPFPAKARDLETQIGNIVRIAAARFPNARLAYFSSRTYGGWAKPRPDGSPPGNSEPYSYETGFAVKWLIEKQLQGDPELNFDPARGAVKAAWLSWGPYLWANGTTPRSDGFHFTRDDFTENDRMHESLAGQRKVGTQLLQFFKNDDTTKSWFLRQTADNAGRRDRARQDLERLQGTWTLTAMEVDGEPRAAEHLEGWNAVYEGDAVTLRVGDEVRRRGIITLDPARSPKAINTWDQDGPHEDQTVAGIYELEGDDLKLCFARPGEARPTEFRTKEGPGHLLVVYKRKKP